MSQSAWWRELLERSNSVYIRLSNEAGITDVVGDPQALLHCKPDTLLGVRQEALGSINARLGEVVAEYLTDLSPGRGGTWPFGKGICQCYTLSDQSIVVKLTADLQTDRYVIGRLADKLPIMVAYIDSNLRFCSINQSHSTFLGISNEALTGQAVSSIIREDSYTQLLPQFEAVLAGKEVHYEDKVILASGRTCYFKAQLLPDFNAGKVDGFYAITQDVTEYCTLIQLLRFIHCGVNRTDVGTDEIVEELLDEALNFLALDIGIVGCTHQDQPCIKWAVASCEDVTSSGHFSLENSYSQLVMEADGVFCTAEAGNDPRINQLPCYKRLGLESYIGVPLRLANEAWGVISFSSHQPRQQPFSDIEIELVKLIADALERIITDTSKIDKIRKERDTMQDKALHDYLTGLNNRFFLEQQVERLISRHPDSRPTFTLCALDIDRFKQVNDTYGHAVGDRLLKWLANTLSNNLRDHDILARIGGDEFVILMHNTSADDAKGAMDRMCLTISEASIAVEDGITLNITISAGLSEYLDNEGYAALFRRADAALYQAKNNGRNQVCRL